MMAWQRRTRAGFTLVELLVATSVMAVALLGIYAIVRQALSAEGRVSVRWRQRADAESAADLLAEALSRCVHLHGPAPVTAGLNASSGAATLTLTCVSRTAAPLTPSVERCRFRWNLPGPDGGEIRLTRQSIPYSGSSNIGATASGDDGGNDWADYPPVTVARGLSQLQVRFRAADGQAPWKSDYQGTGESMLVWIRARVGEVVADRYVTVTATGRIGGES